MTSEPPIPWADLPSGLLSDIVLYDYSTTTADGVRALTETAIDIGQDIVMWLRWTLDGQHILCGVFGSKLKDRRIKRIDILTGHQETLWTSSSILVEDPIISPDGSKLAFYGDDTGVDFYMLEGF